MAIARRLPDVAVTLSSDVSPEMREYERFSTACANAYLQPLMGSYIGKLERELTRAGFRCPMLLMTSGGGITTAETAIRFPVRLVESGPAGGAIFAACIARQHGLDQVVSFDMGGTTAKICFIDKAQPQTARLFEVARIYRFAKGSGLPLRIPVIEMVEIGAGGGSIASVDGLNRILVGPASAGSEPGPVCYGRGGSEPTVTDADVALGRIDPQTFSGGKMALDAAAAKAAIAARIGKKLDLVVEHAALGISEVVDENMANAARVHGIESGKDLRPRTLIAFGGAAPLHAARIAEKLGIGRVLVPANAGVGSAVGLLRAPVAYEVVRGRLMRLETFDAAAANRLLAEMRAEAEAIVRRGAPDGCAHRAPLGADALSRPGPRDHRRASGARFYGSGSRDDAKAVRGSLQPALQPAYSRCRDRDLELGGRGRCARRRRACGRGRNEIDGAKAADRGGRCSIRRAANFWTCRSIGGPDLAPGAAIRGPAVIAEDDTSTVVSPSFDARIDRFGYIELTRREILNHDRTPQRRAGANPYPDHVEPPDRGGRGAGADHDPHRVLDLGARGRRSFRRRVRPPGPHAGASRHRHAGPRQFHGQRRQAFPRSLSDRRP